MHARLVHNAEYAALLRSKVSSCFDAVHPTWRCKVRQTQTTRMDLHQQMHRKAFALHDWTNTMLWLPGTVALFSAYEYLGHTASLSERRSLRASSPYDEPWLALSVERAQSTQNNRTKKIIIGGVDWPIPHKFWWDCGIGISSRQHNPRRCS